MGTSPRRPAFSASAMASWSSAAFMTPFSHKANLLVMGAGGYRVGDFIRVGSLLTIIVLGLLALLIPLGWVSYNVGQIHSLQVQTQKAVEEWVEPTAWEPLEVRVSGPNEATIAPSARSSTRRRRT